MKSPITIKKIESLLFKLPPKRSPSSDDFTREFYHLRFNTILHNVFQKTQKKETFPNSSYEANITLIPKPDKDRTKKVSYRPIGHMNMKKDANKIQQHIKRKNYIPCPNGIYPMTAKLV